MSEKTLKLNIEATEFRTVLKELVSSVDRLNASIDKMGQRTTQNMNTAAGGVKKVDTEAKQLKATLQGLERDAIDFKDKMREATDPKKVKLFKREYRETRNEIGRVKLELKKLGNTGAAAMDKVNKQVSLGRQLFLRLRSVMLTVFGAYAIIQGVRNTVSAIANFELGMARVAAITGATSEEIKKLTDSALLAASSGIFSPSKIAEVEVVLAKLGFTVDEIGQSIEHISNLALATGEDLTTSAELVATTLRGLGLEASQTRHVVDVLGKSFTTSALDVGKYAESIKYLAPIARNMGWSLQDLTSILGVLADNMISGSLAGTGVRQMLIQLADKSSDANKILGRQVETFEDFNELLDKLKNSGAGLNEAVELFNKRSATAVVSLIENTEKLRDYRGEMDKTAGAIKEMADRIRIELIPATQNLNASWQAWLNSTMGTGGLADGLNNIKGAVDAVTLANIHHIRTWNTLGQIFSKYKDEWISFFTGKGFNISNLFRNEGFDLLQTQLASLDENMVLLTSDFGKFFDQVSTDARDYANIQERAIFSVQQYNTKLAEVFTEIGTRESELTENIKRQNEVITELQAGGISNDKRTALLAELDELKIRTIELETLIGFYKVAKKELTDNVFSNLLKVDVEALKDTFYQLSKTYNKFGMDVKNSPTGDYFRNVLLLYQRAILQLKTGTEQVVEELTAEQIAALRDMLNRQQQYELDMASLMEDGAEKEIKIAEIKHKYKKEFSELDISLASGDRELLQAIYNQMSADVKVHLKAVEDIKKKYAEKDLEAARKKALDEWAVEKAKNERIIEELKTLGVEKEKLKKLEIGFEIEFLDWQIKNAEFLGLTSEKVAELTENMKKLKAEFGGISADEVEKNTEQIANAYKKLANEVLDSLKTIVDAQVENTSRLVDDLNTRISEVQRDLEMETELYAAGYASNVTIKKQELSELNDIREQAIKDRERAIRRQQAIEAISQATDLASAIANTISIYSEIPFVGYALAALAVAGFISLFATAQNKAKNITQYGSGGEIDGESHARGGVLIEAEGGEFMMRKSAYAKYPDLIRAINDDALPKINSTFINSIGSGKTGDVVVSTKEWGEIRDLLRDNLSKGGVSVVGGKKIVTSGIRKRSIKLS